MKVISPSLSVYKIQVSSVFSILERITGVFLTLVILLSLYVVKMKAVLLNWYFSYYIMYILFKINFDSIIVVSLFMFILLNFTYHLSFGIRYFVWDSYGMGDLNFKNLKTSVTLYLLISGVVLVAILLLLML